MTPQKFKAIFNGLSSNTKKVYEAVPIKSPWTSSQVVNELRRKGISMATPTVSQNLNILVSNGLVEERERGVFTRKEIKKEGEKVSSKKNLEEAKKMDKANEPETPIDRLIGLSDTVSDLI